MVGWGYMETTTPIKKDCGLHQPNVPTFRPQKTRKHKIFRCLFCQREFIIDKDGCLYPTSNLPPP